MFYIFPIRQAAGRRRTRQRRTRTFLCVGWCSQILRFFLLLFDIPHKISFITFLAAPSLITWRRMPRKNFPPTKAKFVSFFFSPHLSCTRDKSIYRSFLSRDGGVRLFRDFSRFTSFSSRASPHSMQLPYAVICFGHVGKFPEKSEKFATWKSHS